MIWRAVCARPCSRANGVEETLFKGHVLGVNADISTGDLRVSELRNFGNIQGDYHIPPRWDSAR